MIWPDGHTFTPDDIIANLPKLKPVSAFRTKYDYDNLLYIVAGVVVERVSGLSWAEFIVQRFFEPLGMDTSAPSLTLLPDDAEVIDGHVPIDGELVIIEKYSNRILDAAEVFILISMTLQNGSIYCYKKVCTMVNSLFRLSK